jgi:GR25 family glycosyltransferase involved in LPS biosynthesis
MYPFEHIFYINLEHRTDRREQIENELNKMELSYERFPAIYTKGIGIHGCGLSHLSVLKLAKERNYSSVLIFEDDFMFLIEKQTFEEEMKKIEKMAFDVCMLSYNLHESEDIGVPSLKKVIRAGTASGYIVRSHYYDVLIDLLSDAMPKLGATNYHWLYANDIVWCPLQKRDNWYCIVPRVGIQRPGYSDNTERYDDYGV